MANDYEKIDSLGIDIVVNKEAVQSAKNIDKVANALNNLQKAVEGLDLSTLNKAFESLEKLANVSFKGVPKMNTKQLEKVGKVIQARNANLISKINPTQKSGGISVSPTQNFEDIKDKTKEIEKLKKQIDNVGKVAKKPTKNIAKFVRSFGRIAFYRAVRFTLSQTVKAFTSGFDNLAKNIPEVANTMSKLQSSLALVSNSLGSLSYTLLDAFSPAIENIANSLSGFINGLNKVVAISAGADYYYEATEAVRDYDKALNNLSFDKFESLNDASSNTFEKVMLRDEQGNIISENAKLTESQQLFLDYFDTLKIWWGSLKRVLNDLWDILKPVWNVLEDAMKGIKKGIKWLDDQKITEDLSVLDAILWTIIGTLGVLAIVSVASNPFAWIGVAIAGIGLLVEKWDVVSKWFKDSFESIGDWFKGVFSSIGNWFSDLWDGIKEKWTNIGNSFKNLGFYLNPLNWGKPAPYEVSSFATGGQYQTGDFFVANENGMTEMIASSNGGGSVMNLRQWQQISEQSFYTALYKYGASRGNIADLELGVYMDSREVGKAVENSVYNEGVRVGHFSRAK